jgi:hypothetical protein
MFEVTLNQEIEPRSISSAAGRDGRYFAIATSFCPNTSDVSKKCMLKRRELENWVFLTFLYDIMCVQCALDNENKPAGSGGFDQVNFSHIQELKLP